VAHCQKKKVGLVRHPQLINMKKNKCPRNKYPQFIMGVLAKASMGRPKHALKVPLLFFLLSFFGGGGGKGGKGFFFSNFPGSQCVATMFSSSSQCVPQHVLHSTSLFSHMHPPFTYICSWAKGEELYTSK